MMIGVGFSAATAAVVGICLSLVTVIANRERTQNISERPSFRIQKTLSYTLIAVAVGSCVLGLFWLSFEPHYKGQDSDAFVPIIIGLLSILSGLIFKAYQVNLDDANICFGLMGQRKIDYTSIAEIQDIRYEGSPRMILVTNSGKRIGIWSNLVGYDELVAELQRRCNCAYTLMDKCPRNVSH